jgi:hypothetical protein
LIRADRCGSFEAYRAACGHIVVLIYAVSADAEAAYQYTIQIERLGAREI